MVDVAKEDTKESVKEPSKGYNVNLTFSKDFVNCLERLYKKYGEEIFSIQGIANKHLDICSFRREFFNKSSNVAYVTVDDNANVKDKNICQYYAESNKAIRKLCGLYILYKYVKNLYSKKEAQECLEKIVSGELFVNDLPSVDSAYCYAFDLRVLMNDGMKFYQGGPPKRASSFIEQLIQSTAFISNEIAGAAAFPGLMADLHYFYAKEYGKGFTNNRDTDEKMVYKIENDFQNLIFSLGFTYRNGQSAFTNVSIMDRGYLKELFSDYVYPDGSLADIEGVRGFGKWFYEYFCKINGEEGIFTFPVITLSISVDKEGNYIDPDFVDWVAKSSHKKGLGNIYQGPPTAASSCCRLSSDLSKLNNLGYMNSFGVSGLSVGSTRVVGLNMPRIAILEKENPNSFQESLDCVHKVLLAHRKIIEDRIEGGYLPLYTHGWMSLKRQYMTVGFVGAYEYVVNKGLSIQTKEGVDCLLEKLDIVGENIKQWQLDEETEGHIFNLEQIPAESTASRLAKIDNILGYNDKWELYSNQYIPLIEDAPIYDRFQIQGAIDKKTSGGAILHLNIDDEKPLTKTQFLRIIKMAKDSGTVYFAVNYAFSECENKHYSVGKKTSCPKCKGKIVEFYTRVVGFLVPVSSWNKTRQEFEFPRRYFYGKHRIGE